MNLWTQERGTGHLLSAHLHKTILRCSMRDAKLNPSAIMDDITSSAWSGARWEAYLISLPWGQTFFGFPKAPWLSLYLSPKHNVSSSHHIPQQMCRFISKPGVEWVREEKETEQAEEPERKWECTQVPRSPSELPHSPIAQSPIAPEQVTKAQMTSWGFGDQVESPEPWPETAAALRLRPPGTCQEIRSLCNAAGSSWKFAYCFT